MSTSLCEDCQEIRDLKYQLGMTSLDVKEACLVQTNKDIEHESMIQNLGNRMGTMSQEFIDFKKEMKDEVQSIKTEIPAMFDNAVNKLLARILKWAIGVIALVFLIGILTTVLAFNRNNIVKALQELQQKVEHMEVSTK